MAAKNSHAESCRPTIRSVSRLETGVCREEDDAEDAELFWALWREAALYRLPARRLARPKES